VNHLIMNHPTTQSVLFRFQLERKNSLMPSVWWTDQSLKHSSQFTFSLWGALSETLKKRNGVSL